MKSLLASLPWLALPLAAQVSLPRTPAPDTNDLNALVEVPFMAANSRMQCFYEAREFANPALLVGKLAFRYDGPDSGTATPRTIQRLTVRLGTTQHDVANLGAEFAANLTQPLAVVFQSPLNFVTDGLHTTSGPEVYGGPGGHLRLVLATPVALTIPAGGSFALEVVAEGNDNAGRDSAFLDFHLDASAAQGLGTQSTSGRGCPTPSVLGQAQLSTAGPCQPGAPLVVFGDGFPASTPVVLLLTGATLANPLALPATAPVCWIYLDLSSGTLLPFGASTATGVLDPASGGGDPLPIPKKPGLCGVKLYVQTASPTPLSSNNLFGVQTSNYRTVQLGCAQAPQTGAWFVANHRSATAGVGVLAVNGAPALRLE